MKHTQWERENSRECVERELVLSTIMCALCVAVHEILFISKLIGTSS